uniref:Uncharacterized protein n=1 Tax=Anopheles dirus TaxID=7168 RepID=A0A182NSR5_9DIPT
INVDIEVLFVGNRLVLGSTVILYGIPWANGTTMDPSATGTASGGAILPTCSTISSAASQMHPNPAAPFGALGGTMSGHGPTGSGPGGGGGGGGEHASSLLSPTLLSPGTNTGTASIATSRDEEDDSSNQASSGSKGSGQRSRTPPKAHTSLVSRTNSEDSSQRGGYQSTDQCSPGRAGLARRTTVPGHYQSIDRSHSFNDHDRDAMSRWYRYHQQRHPLSRTGSVARGQRRRYSLRDNADDEADSVPTGLNRMVSFDSVGGHSAGGPLLTRHRISQPSLASSSFDQFEPGLDAGQQQQRDQQQQQQQHQQLLNKSISNGTTRGAQSWKNLRAVMAYYCSLRKIKR